MLGRMAQFRINQLTPGVGTPGESRHDLVPGEGIALVATSPLAGPGITYTWELLDRVGSGAVLAAATGPTVSIGPSVAIAQPCAFLIKLVVNDNGAISEDVRIASVRTASLGLRTPLFPESAATANRLALNDPDRSTDNAVYPNRSGTGITEKNWRGWAEWAWELTNAVESLAAAPVGGGVGTKWWLEATDAIVVPSRHQYLVQGTILVDLGGSLTTDLDGQVVII